MTNEYISCIKDNKTGICRDLKDREARTRLDVVEKAINTFTGVEGGHLATDVDIQLLQKQLNEKTTNLQNQLDENTPAVNYAENERLKSKNLLPPLKLNAGTTETKSGVTCTVNADGSITVSGTATARANFYFEVDSIKKAINKIGTYTTKCTGSEQPFYFQVVNNGEYITYINGLGARTINITETPNITSFYLSINEGQTVNSTFNIQIEEGTQATEYQAYNGAIVHEKQLTNYEIIQGKNIEAVTNSSLTSLLEYVNYFNKNDSITYVADIGALQTSNLKTLLGTPEGMANYVTAFISKCLEYTGTSNLRYAFKVQALQSFSNKFAIGYIYQTGGVAYFTGWTVLN